MSTAERLQGRQARQAAVSYGCLPSRRSLPDACVADESGSDSEGAESTSSSYSSLSDLVSEMVSSDVSPGFQAQACPVSMSSGLDPHTVYHPPDALQYPGAGEEEPAGSAAQDTAGDSGGPDEDDDDDSSDSDLSSPELNKDNEMATRLPPGPRRESGSNRTESASSGGGDWEAGDAQQAHKPSTPKTARPLPRAPVRIDSLSDE